MTEEELLVRVKMLGLDAHYEGTMRLGPRRLVTEKSVFWIPYTQDRYREVWDRVLNAVQSEDSMG